MAARRRIVICGAAGRDFHNFNVVFRGDPAVEVVAFTAAQIPGIDDRRYPASLAGPAYPDGIPILPQSALAEICERDAVTEVVFAYSDVEHGAVMATASGVLAAGADFTLLGPRATMLASKRPTIAVCAVRTGCGKSQVARFLAARLAARGLRVAGMRHPMPYGNLAEQAVQRFGAMADLDAAHCTLEEREEYEPWIAAGGVVFAGVDYARILARVEAETDIVIWDGGNNDFAFVAPDFHIVVVDALRPGQLDTHYPGAAVLQMADLVVINKAHAATPAQLAEVRAGVARLRPRTPTVIAASPVTIDDPAALSGARVLIVEDGPTITHGGMAHGAGYQAVRDLDVAEIVDPRAAAAPAIAEVFARYPHIGPVLPAMGYSEEQMAALAQTIDAANVDVVVAGTPIDLARVLDVAVPVVRARYEYADTTSPGLMGHVDAFLASAGL